MLEDTIEKHLVAAVEALGGRCVKQPANLYRGIPDRLVLLPGGRVIFIELKRPGKKVEDSGPQSAQGRWRDWLQERGLEWAQLDTKEKIDRFFNGILLKTRS